MVAGIEGLSAGRLIAMKVAAETSNGEGRKRPAAKRKHGRGDRRTRRRVQAASSAIQRLFLACRTVFKGPGTVPEPANVEKLQLLLGLHNAFSSYIDGASESYIHRSAETPFLSSADKMRPEDVGLSTDILFFREEDTSKKTSRITYATIYKCDNFSVTLLDNPLR